MGPFPPPALNDQNLPERRPALKWLDDPKKDDDLDKEKLRTNLSCEDLNLQDLDKLKPVTTHRDNKKSKLKSTIKKFALDVN
jgi:hypothetical protein